MTIFVSKLHPHLKERDIYDIFAACGRVKDIRLIKDSRSGKSKGLCYIEFGDIADVRNALALHGQLIDGHPISIQPVGNSIAAPSPSFSAGAGSGGVINNNNNSRNTHSHAPRQNVNGGDMKHIQSQISVPSVPTTTNSIIHPVNPATSLTAPAAQIAITPTLTATLPSVCIILSNVFDPDTETDPEWDVDIREAMIEECSKYGPLVHCFVDKTDSRGRIFLRFASLPGAQATCIALNGRWFDKRQLAVTYMPDSAYLAKFPEADTTSILPVSTFVE